MFNADQQAHMDSLARTPAEQLHWCGWFWIGEVGHDAFHPQCPRDLTAADKLNMRCECCHNEPWLEHGGRLVHLANCTPERRHEHYVDFDLGGES